MRFFVIRFFPEVPLSARRHDVTLGRFATWEGAEETRLSRPSSHLLVVEERREGHRR